MTVKKATRTAPAPLPEAKVVDVPHSAAKFSDGPSYRVECICGVSQGGLDWAAACALADKHVRS